jgi:hypothetical protein
MRTYRDWSPAVALMLAIAFAPSAHAADAMHTKISGPYRVELQVLPAEPFFSKEEVTAKHITEGMEIEGGAAPVMLDAASHPNHHLIVQLFSRQTDQVATNATVDMKFGPLDDKGHPAGALVEVPIVVMQAIGKGPSSTHYGNNVTMPARRYRVLVSINNDVPVHFNISPSDVPSMPMGHMNKM